MAMITPRFCLDMAQYNTWQNSQIAERIDGVSNATLTRDRGAFFGSILGTLSHLLWGDLMWMARFDPSVDRPRGTIAQSVDMVSDAQDWQAKRTSTDRTILDWAKGLTDQDLDVDLEWTSASTRRRECRPAAFCATHMFNHQTHHRGQVHAMMTAAGLTAPVSDLFLMPEAA
ncbi:MAG: DinB family protein [Pseudomonadota bacterium]